MTDWHELENIRVTARVLSTVIHLLRFGLFLVIGAAFGAGCNKDETAIRTYTAPKDIPAPQVASAEQSPPDSPTPEPSGPATAAPITWTIPGDWKQIPGSSAMRFATFAVSADDPKAQVTVVPLPSEAGAIVPNLTRWAGQLKLPAVTDSDVPIYARQTQVSGEQSTLVDMTGSAESGTPPTRLLAAIIPHEDRVWFLTLKAPEPIVAGQKANFERFVHSIQFPTGPVASAEPPSPIDKPPDIPGQPSGESFKLVSYKAPADWQEEPGANAMRVTSFRVGSGAEQAEVIVSRIGQGQTGSFVDNINRWRGQVGLEPVAEQKFGELKPITMAGHQALFLPLTGPSQADQPAKQILVAIDIEGKDFWFVKMLGPESVVSSQQAAFQQFLDSFKFEPESH
jgi:hypothetical protein